MTSTYTKLKFSLALAAGLLGASSVGFAQMAETNISAPKPQMETPPSRWDVFLGYSYYAPHGSLHNINATTCVPDPTTGQPVCNPTFPDGTFRYQSADYGAIGQATWWWTRYFGFQAEYGAHQLGKNDHFQNVLGGVAFRFPWNDITPFIHGMAGASQVGGPNFPGSPACTQNPCQPGTDIYVAGPATWGAMLETGGGVDYALPWFNHHLSLRVFQADYNYIHVNFGPGNTQSTPPGNVLGGRANIDAVQLSSGLVFGFGSIAPPPAVVYSCTVSPSSVYPGEPITITGTATNLNPKKTATYSWTSSGPHVTGTTATATIDTTGTAPGTYTVSGHVSEGSKAGQMADCSATITVMNFQPPTVSCSANPSTVAPGADSAITAMGSSPQNRPLTYSYSTSAGTVDSSTSTTTTLHTTGAAPGPITVTCNVQDDKGQTASATTTVTVEAPAAPATPHVQKLCSISFGRDKRRPARVDNEAKACLDEVALSLQQQSSATAVVVGESATGEKMGDKLAHERAVNTKAYLTTEKGVDGSRIETRVGPEGTAQVENYLVPSGATFDSDVQGTTKFEGEAPKAEKPMKRHHHKKMAAAPAAAPAQ